MKIKTTIILFFLLVGIRIFSQNLEEKNYGLAVVEKINGVYLFIESKPYHAYDFIATIDVDKEINKLSKPEFEKLILKSRKRYPHFNGMIFRLEDDKLKAELIIFRGIEKTAGGFRVGDKIVIKDGNRPKYGEVIIVDLYKETASINYINIYGEKITENVKLRNLNPLSEDDYAKFIEEQNEEIKKYKFQSGEKVQWKKGNTLVFGKVISLNDKNHKASLSYYDEYGIEVFDNVGYLEIAKLEESEYESKHKSHMEKVKLHQFSVGEKVRFTYSEKGQKKSIIGEIIAIENGGRKASIKYIDSTNLEKIIKLDCLEIFKNE